MNFLVDAQLPRRLAHLLRRFGHDAIHTLDVSKRNRTEDDEILALCSSEQRVLLTKDAIQDVFRDPAFAELIAGLLIVH